GPASSGPRLLAGRRQRAVGQAGQLGSDAGRVGVVQVVEDGQRPQPGVTGAWPVARVLVGVAQAGQGLGLAGTVADPGPPGRGTGVAAHGLRVVAQAVIGQAQAVQRGGFAQVVAELAVEMESLAEVVEGLLVVTEEGFAPADGVQGPGLPDPVPGGTEGTQRPE